MTFHDVRAGYELLEGAQSRGLYLTRETAMTEAERIAAVRGQTVAWVALSDTAMVGTPQPASGSEAFTVRACAGQGTDVTLGGRRMVWTATTGLA